MRPVWIVVTFGNIIVSVHTSKAGAEERVDRLCSENHDPSGYWCVKRELED